MTARIIALAIASFAIVACEDVTRSIDPTLEVSEDTLTVFPLTGSPVSAPNALDLFALQTLRVGAATAQCVINFCPYDIAIDTAGNAAVVYPIQLVEVTGLPRTAILEPTTDFDAISEAPTSGYQDTAAVTLTPGETVIVRARNQCTGGFPGRDFFFAKVQLLDFGFSNGFRIARFRVRTNPNCGFRSFADGLPGF
jgi:hypothetical protein